MFLDREIHWMYNKGRLQPRRKLKGSYVELVVSASRAFAALTREQAIAQGRQRTGGVLSCGPRGATGKGGFGQRDARHFRCPAGD